VIDEFTLITANLHCTRQSRLPHPPPLHGMVFCVIAVKLLCHELNTADFIFLAVGGLCYTVGMIF
jgi:hypothetical protein